MSLQWNKKPPNDIYIHHSVFICSRLRRISIGRVQRRHKYDRKKARRRWAKKCKSKPFEMRSEMVKEALESRVAVSFVAISKDCWRCMCAAPRSHISTGWEVSFNFRRFFYMKFELVYFISFRYFYFCLLWYALCPMSFRMNFKRNNCNGFFYIVEVEFIMHLWWSHESNK